MKLPTAEERRAIRDEQLRKERAYEEQKQRDADAAAEAALKLRDQRIIEIVAKIHGAISGAVAYGQDHVYIRLQEGREWTADNLMIANEVCRRMTLEGDDYTFALAIEDWSYTDNRQDNDGYPSGPEYWVHKHSQAIKVTWPEPLLAELVEEGQ